MTEECTAPVCRRRTAALSQLVDLLQPDRDQRQAYLALDAALHSGEAALVDVPPDPATIRCRACGQVKPLAEYSNTGQTRQTRLALAAGEPA